MNMETKVLVNIKIKAKAFQAANKHRLIIELQPNPVFGINNISLKLDVRSQVVYVSINTCINIRDPYITV